LYENGTSVTNEEQQIAFLLSLLQFASLECKLLQHTLTVHHFQYRASAITGTLRPL